MSIWVVVRWVIMLTAAAGELFAPLHPLAHPPIGWVALLAIFGGCSVGMVLVLGLQAANPFSAKQWLRPSWRSNPLNFRQPMQFFHLGAYVCLAQGLVLLLRLVFSHVPFYLEALVPMVMALGILVGLELVSLLFRAKVESRA
ncbi:MAG TPA: hypothetical protein VGU65_08130 [Frateuria sp.]|uniref:hypothetical protein n=1 Tax=Frateuria sp. TaxID=2211372 RepID=UPI002DE6AE68|nr:hypothetical protein [Frateuria sp.]